MVFSLSKPTDGVTVQALPHKWGIYGYFMILRVHAKDKKRETCPDVRTCCCSFAASDEQYCRMP